MFKVNNKDTRTTPTAYIVNFEHVTAGWGKNINILSYSFPREKQIYINCIKCISHQTNKCSKLHIQILYSYNKGCAKCVQS